MYFLCFFAGFASIPPLITKYSTIYELYFLSHSKLLFYLTPIKILITNSSQRLEGSARGGHARFGSCKGHTVPPGLAIVAHLRANVNSSWGDLEFVPNHSSTFKSQHSSRAEATVNPCRLSGVIHREKNKFFWKFLGDFSIRRAILKFQQLLDQILLQTVTKRSGQQNTITLTSKNQITLY